jgi:hypothetical protein
MRKQTTTRVSGIGVHAVMPTNAIAPRRQVQRRLDEREDDKPREQTPPPPGMGMVVDKSA